MNNFRVFRVSVEGSDSNLTEHYLVAATDVGEVIEKLYEQKNVAASMVVSIVTIQSIDVL